MKRLFTYLLLLTCCTNTGNAQNTKKVLLSAGANIGYVGTYDLAVFWGTGIGVSMQAEYPVTEKMHVLVFAGHDHYLGYSLLNGDKPPAIKMTAVRTGAKYYVYRQFYLAAQAGLGIAGGGGEIAALSTFGIKGSSFSYTPQAGYTFIIHQKKRIDVSARYEMFHYRKNFQTAGCRIAWVF
ncbi:MAG TPA: hypothetical protein PKC39_14880 [Ferruginibacter sp.]|nr:hypothetical protein [Ferruginibacter sp.]HMP22242.1 hypothetical protein [Ferruginibacter sp.]